MVDPITAAGALLALVAGTALITYGLLTVPGKLAAAAGPPDEFRLAATQQAGEQVTPSPGITSTAESPGGQVSGSASTPAASATAMPEANNAVPPAPTSTSNPYGNWPLAAAVDADYWLSIPAIHLEAPVIGFMPWEREVEGAMVLRLPVPNSFAVSWDMRSSEPGFGGNTVLTGHSNLYGGVFGDLDLLNFGDEVALWSPYGVFSYYVSQIEYIEDNNQPLEVRLQNAQWLQQTADQRVTLITCWPNNNSTHRLLVIATR